MINSSVQNVRWAWNSLPRVVHMLLFVLAFVALGLYLAARGMPANMMALPAFGAVIGMTMIGRNAGQAGTFIMAGVLGLVAVVVAIVAWTPQVEAIDTYAFLFNEHCELAGDKFLRVFEGSATAPDFDTRLAVTVGTPSNKCTIGTASAVTVGLWTGGAEYLGLAAAGTLTAANKVGMLDITTQYAGISRMIIGVMPILNTAAFLGVTGANIFMLVRGVGGVQAVIVGTILALILSIVAMNFGPTVITQMDAIHTSVTVGRFFSLEMFGKIIELIVEFFPTVYTVGLLAVVGLLGVVTGVTYGRNRSSMAGGGGGRM